MTVVFLLVNELSMLFVCFPLKLTESCACSFFVCFFNCSVAFWKLFIILQGFHDFHYVNVADRYVLVSLCCCQPGFKLIMNICYVSITVLHENAPDVFLNAIFIFSLFFISKRAQV